MIYEFNGYKPVIKESAFIHPQATVTGNVIIGEKVYIGPGAAIRGDWVRSISVMDATYRKIAPSMFFPANPCY